MENNPSAWTPASLDQYRIQMIEGPTHGLHVHPDMSRAANTHQLVWADALSSEKAAFQTWPFGWTS